LLKPLKTLQLLKVADEVGNAAKAADDVDKGGTLLKGGGKAKDVPSKADAGVAAGDRLTDWISLGVPPPASPEGRR
jgi:hypothetical protein